MDRLTIRESASYDLIKMNNEWCVDYCKEQPVQTCRDCAIHEAIQKLAYYEDLEESGKLKALPCKIGDIVYVVSPLYTFPKKHVHERKICRFLTIESDWYFETEMFTHKLEEFGVNVFLTREEAENKLKEME